MLHRKFKDSLGYVRISEKGRKEEEKKQRGFLEVCSNGDGHQTVSGDAKNGGGDWPEQVGYPLVSPNLISHNLVGTFHTAFPLPPKSGV